MNLYCANKIRFRHRHGFNVISNRNVAGIVVTSKYIRCHSSSSNTSNQVNFTPKGPCPVLEWASQIENRKAASECLIVPKLLPHYKYTDRLETGMQYTDWDDYMKHRKWILPSQLKNETEREYGRALVTHIMSAPMTVLSVLDQLLLGADTMEWKKENTTRIRVCCLGARSEASLPIQYWQEMVDLIHARRRVAGWRVIDTSNTTKPDILDIRLDFIGPEMNVQPKIVLQSKQQQHNDEFDFVGDFIPILTQCTIQWRYKGFYHTYFDEVTELAGLFERNYDSYILFNPGIGHPHLTSSWAPTLQLLFDQYYRISSSNGCTIVMTAHSSQDAKRDSIGLRKYLPTNDSATQVAESDNNQMYNRYIENPFASRIYYQDPIIEPNEPHPHIVRPNHYITVFDRLDSGKASVS